MNEADQYFDPETLMSVSTISGVDSGDGNYLNVLTEPVNIVQNSLELINILQFDVVRRVNNHVNRVDPGAAIRDAVSFLSRYNPRAGGILYLVSRRYVDSNSTVKELDMIGTLLRTKISLICVEGGSIFYPNRLLNLNRVAELTEGYYFTNPDNKTDSWPNANDAAVKKLIDLSRSPINSVRRVVRSFVD